MSGEMCYVNNNNRKKIKSLGSFGKSPYDTILGICWFKNCDSNSNNNNRFITGSSKGNIVCGQTTASSSLKSYIVSDYPQFEKLTSVHLNRGNDSLLVSGYSNSAQIYDVQTGAVTHTYNDIHADHINISRFSNLSPHIFATSSFDKTIKTWDKRMNCNASQALYTVQCNTGIVMINFSSDDVFFLASALDNEINQYFFLDGRKHLSYNIPKTGLMGNFSRSYYSKSARYVLTGSCEEDSFKVMCSYTGEVLTAVDMYNGKKDDSIYIQSLRGSPVDDNTVCVLTNYRDIQRRELVIARNVKRSNKIFTQFISPSNKLNDLIENKNIADTNDEKFNTIQSSIDDIRNQYYSDSYLKDLSDLRQEGKQIVNCISQMESSSNQIGIDLKLDIETIIDDCIFKLHPKILQSNVFFLFQLVPKHIINKKMKTLCNNYKNYPVLKSCISFQSDNEEYELFLFPVHYFLISSRCPKLQENEMSYNFLNIYLNGDPKLPLKVLDLKNTFSAQLTYLFPIILDYLYYGNSAIDLVIIRYLCLSILVNNELSEGRSLGEVLLKLHMHPPLSYNEDDFHNNFIIICSNDNVWRDDFLNVPFIDILKDLLDISVCLNLYDFQTIIESYLSKSIQISNYFTIYDLSVIFGKNKLRNCCLKFFINHIEFISTNQQNISFLLLPDIANNTKFDIKDGKKRLKSIEYNIDDNNFNHLSNLHKMLEDVVVLWNSFSCEVLSREGFRVRKIIVNTISISELLSQRLSLLNNHRELYDIYENAFSAIENFNESVSIQDECPFLYGNEDIPSSICLPKYMNHCACRYSNDIIMFFGGMNRERFHGLNRILTFNESTNDFKYVTCGGDNISISSATYTVSLKKVDTRYIVMLSGFSKRLESAKKYSSLPISSVFECNEALKRHDMKNPTKIPIDELYFKDKIDNETIDFDNFISQETIFVLDCQTLSWFTPKIKIDLSKNYNSNILRSLNSADLKQLVFASIKYRAGQTVTPLYSEDIKYRCKACLLGDDFATCNCNSIKDFSPHSKTETDTHCWIIQFGGYCTKTQLIKSDIHVVVCNHQSSKCNNDNTFELINCRVSGNIPIGRFSHTSVMIPHSGNIFETGADGQRLFHSYSHTRMFVYGGISQENEMDELLSMRINYSNSSTDFINRNNEGDFHWENVIVNGPTPGKRHGHSMTYLDEKEIVLLYGGVQHNRSAIQPDRVMSDIWCCTIENLHWFTNGEGLQEFGICVRWELINVSGVPPSPRSRHSCNYNIKTGLLHIFGGVEENTNELENNNEDGLQSIDENQKDFISHPLHISIHRSNKSNQRIIQGSWINDSKSSRFIHFPCEPVIEIPSCSLSDSLSSLINGTTGTKYSTYRDLTFDVLPGVLEKDSNSFHCYSSIIAKRCDWVNTILSSNMKEATSMKITVMNDSHNFSSLLFYLYSDKLVFADINDLCGIMELANQYNIIKLIKLCEHAFIRYSNDDNIFQLLEYADIFNLEMLHLICVSKIFRRNDIMSLLNDESDDVTGIKNSTDLFNEIPIQIKSKVKEAFISSCHVYRNQSN